MWFFNNKKKKKRMEEEKEKQDFYDSFRKTKDYNNMSLNDLFKLMYGNTTFDDYFKDILNNAKSGEYHYKHTTYEHTQPRVDESLNNAFKLMSLNKDDDEKTIKKRYRELSMKWHPDKYQNDTVENQVISTRNFRKLNNSYELIKKHKGIK